MAEYNKVPRDELLKQARDKAHVRGLPEGDRERMQLDLCRRFGWKWTRDDGTVPDVPVTQPGDEL